MNNPTENQEIRALVAPIPGSSLVVPGSVVAEVVEYSDPFPFRNAPEWLPGEVAWNGWKIPLVNMALLAGTDPHAVLSPRHRFLVLKTLSDATSVLHVAVIISGLPRLQKLTRGTLEETGAAVTTGVFSHVMLGEQAGVIPDLGGLARAIEDAVYKK